MRKKHLIIISESPIFAFFFLLLSLDYFQETKYIYGKYGDIPCIFPKSIKKPPIEEINEMSTQDNQESAFIKSMRQIRFYTEWVEITKLGVTERDCGDLSREQINLCNENAERTQYKRCSWIQTPNERIYSFVVLIDQILDETDKDFTNDLWSLLASINRTERELVSISVTPKGESDFHNVYFLRLIFSVTE